MTEVNEQVVAGADDCYVFEYPTPSTMRLDLGKIILGYQCIAGMRFQGVAVPNGAIITAAKLSFYNYAALAGDIDSLYIYGEDTDDAATYSTVGDFNARTRTTEKAAWSPGAWAGSGWYDSPEIKDIVKEIVDRGGWASGQDMAFFVQHEGSSGNYRQGFSYEENSVYAAKLHIEYMATYTKQPSSKDTLLHKGSPTTNYGSAVNIHVFSGVTGSTRRFILEFDITDFPGGVISSASLRLYYYYHAIYDPVGRVIWAYKMTHTDWVELQATWNIYKTDSDWTAPGGDYVTSDPSGGSVVVPADYGWMEWDIKDIVEDAIDAEGSMVELLVKEETEVTETARLTYFRSRDYTDDTDFCPKLVIEYAAGGVSIPVIMAHYRRMREA